MPSEALGLVLLHLHNSDQCCYREKMVQAAGPRTIEGVGDDEEMQLIVPEETRQGNDEGNGRVDS